MDKQIYDLTVDDLRQFPVWYFPMDETVTDELSIRPLKVDGEGGGDPRVIVRTFFTDSSGKDYLGYIYWCGNSKVNECQPVLYFSNNDCLAFWHGIVKPDKGDYGPDVSNLLDRLPISFESEDAMGLRKIIGCLQGLYYIDDRDNIVCS